MIGKSSNSASSSSSVAAFGGNGVSSLVILTHD